MLSNRNILSYIVAVLMLLLALLTWSMGFDGAYGQDSYAYLAELAAFRSGNLTQQFYPLVYAFLATPFSYIVSNAQALQWISILSGGCTALLLYRILLSHTKDRMVLIMYTSVCFLASPIILRMQVLVMSDLLAATFSTAAFYAAFYRKQSDQFGLFFILSALAVLTRYPMAVVLLVPLLYTARQSFQKADFQTKLYTFTGFTLGAAVLVIHYVFFSSDKGSLQHNWLQLWQFSNFFSREFDHLDGRLSYNLPNVVFVFRFLYHPKFLLLFLPLLLFIRKEDIKGKNIYLLSSILLYSFFLAGIPFQNERFMLPLFPLTLILLYPAFVRLKNFCQPYFRWIVLLIPFQLYLAWHSLKPVYQRYLLEKHVVKALLPFQKNILYTFDLDIALQGRGLQFEYRNLWKTRYQNFDSNALFLFNPVQFEKQWENKNPMLNWKLAEAHYQLTPELTLPEGWVLYRIRAKR